MRFASRTVQSAGVALALLASSAAHATYWNLFNREDEADLSAQFVTYNTLDDMLADTNRLGVFTPDHFGAGENIVGSGSNGSTYWNLFNREGETDLPAQYVTYASLDDMLADTNRLGVFTPDHFGAGENIIDGGSNGSTYWNLFNREGETDLSAQYVTYASLSDMLDDTNRLGIFTPDHFGAGENIIGTGSDSFPTTPPPGGNVRPRQEDRRFGRESRQRRPARRRGAGSAARHHVRPARKKGGSP